MTTPATAAPLRSEAALELTVFKKSAGILSKIITAAADGSPVSDASACWMSSGEAKRMPLPGGAQALADLIGLIPIVDFG